jgi:hypothetical protein
MQAGPSDARSRQRQRHGLRPPIMPRAASLFGRILRPVITEDYMPDSNDSRALCSRNGSDGREG